MLETVYCDDSKCAAYKNHVRYTFVLLRRSRACEVCGQPMVDGARLNDDFKNGRKRVVGKELIVRGKRQPTRFKTQKKRPATKRAGYKR